VDQKKDQEGSKDQSVLSFLKREAAPLRSSAAFSRNERTTGDS